MMDQEKYKQIRANSWKQAKTTLIVVGVILLILAGMAVLGSSGSSTDSVSGDQPTQEAQTQATSAPVKQVNIQVTSQIVKKIDGKHRYFFSIKNADTEDFAGSVKVTLYNSRGSKLAEDTFETQSLKAGLVSSVSLDANTGPTGELGISKYTFVVIKNKQEVAKGEGVISTEFEDLSGM